MYYNRQRLGQSEPDPVIYQIPGTQEYAVIAKGTWFLTPQGGVVTGPETVAMMIASEGRDGRTYMVDASGNVFVREFFNGPWVATLLTIEDAFGPGWVLAQGNPIGRTFLISPEGERIDVTGQTLDQDALFGGGGEGDGSAPGPDVGTIRIDVPDEIVELAPGGGDAATPTGDADGGGGAPASPATPWVAIGAVLGGLALLRSRKR